MGRFLGDMVEPFVGGGAICFRGVEIDRRAGGGFSSPIQKGIT